MIVVGGFNTAVDRFLEVDRVDAGTHIRARRSRAAPGGKGLHVALAAATLGEEVTLVGIVDSMHRAWFEAYLKERNVLAQLVEVSHPIRTCVAIKDSEGKTTEILEGGPTLSRTECETLLSRFRALSVGGIAVLSGSIPRGLRDDTYRTLLRSANDAGSRTLLDTSGRNLALGIEAPPFLVKINEPEGRELSPARDPRALVEALADSGVAVAVVTLGRAGALASWQGRLCRLEAPSGKTLNPVGSGDAFLGGVAAGLSQGLDPEDVLKLGIACGSAHAQSPEDGFFEKGTAKALSDQVRVHWEPGAPQ
jgi:1-phosphofructokinase family hexose kinase